MKVSVSVGSAYYDGSRWEDLVAYVAAAERLGSQHGLVGRGVGMGAVASLGYLAAVTDRIRLGSGIMQISAHPGSNSRQRRAMPCLAQLSATASRKAQGQRTSGGRGPALAPELADPAGRLREYIEIVRMGLRRLLAYEGRHYVLPHRAARARPVILGSAPPPIC